MIKPLETSQSSELLEKFAGFFQLEESLQK